MSAARVRTRRLGLVALVATTAFGGPAIGVAQAKPKASGPAVTCEEHGGGKPGDTVTVETTITINGKPYMTESHKEICGEDGMWHPVAKAMVGPTGPVQIAASQAIAAQVTLRP